MPFTRILPLAVATILLSASPAAAQSAITSNATSVAGPRVDQTRVGIAVVRGAWSGALPTVPQPAITRRKGVPQMIIGGAAILGGAVVGGDAGNIVGLAGLGYGLYGLYLYLH